METYCLVAEGQRIKFPVTPSSASAPTAVSTVADARVHMPQLPVPKFSGNCVDWPGYYDAFTRLIHQNERLDNIQRFHFLKESLPAGRDCDIRQIPLTAANYTVAWDTLIQRYNNPRVVFSNHMNMLYQLPSLSKEKPDDIRSMISAVNVCAAACNTINASLQNGDHWLAHYLTAKLPKETHSAWEHHLGSQTHIPSYKDLEQFLNNRLITLDAIENRNCSGTNKSGSSLDHHPTKRISVHNTHAQPSPPVLRCPHCNGNHILRRCQQFLSLDCYQRKEVVSKSNLCLNCLSKSHMLARTILYFIRPRRQASLKHPNLTRRPYHPVNHISLRL